MLAAEKENDEMWRRASSRPAKTVYAPLNGFLLACKVVKCSSVTGGGLQSIGVIGSVPLAVGLSNRSIITPRPSHKQH